MKVKHSVFGFLTLSERACYGVGERSTLYGIWRQERERQVYDNVFAVYWVPHDSNERINRSCILSGFNSTDRVCNFRVEIPWSILTCELPHR